MAQFLEEDKVYEETAEKVHALRLRGLIEVC